MLKTHKYRIYPNCDQEILINKTFGVCRFIYNLALETKKTAWQSAKRNLTAFDLCKQLPDLKKEYPWIAEVDSQAINASVINMDKAYKAFFSGKGFPKFKKKNGRQSFSCQWNKREVDFEAGTISVPKIYAIKAELSRPFIGQIKSINISKTPTGKYFASILVDTKIEAPAKPAVRPESTIGIDLGIKSFAITSTGKEFEPNRFLKDAIKRLKCLQRRASRKKKGSNNRKKANLCVAILHEKIQNQRVDYCHKITTGLIRDNQAETFVIEDLAVVNMLKNHKIAQAISDVGWGEFRRQMTYKCDWYGKNLIVIGRFEPSSKTCGNCLVINETLTLRDREWTCANCGTIHDRDLNAAINIKRIGLEQYSRRGTPGGPVESRRLRRAKKQELLTGKNVY